MQDIATLSYLAIQEIPNWREQSGKHLSGSGEKEKREERRWKENEETRRKLHNNLGLGDCFERP